MQNVKLNDGNSISAVGFGVFLVEPNGPTYEAVKEANQAGYRHIDTAAAYFNEEDVGKAVRDSGVSREEMFIISKLWLQDYGYEAAKKGIDASLQKLGMDYMDLYLLQQPYGDGAGAWKALEETKKEGKFKSIGVSNMTPRLWKEFTAQFDTVPAVNQVECNPFFQQKELRKLLDEKGVRVEAWYPLGHGSKELLLGDISEANLKRTADELKYSGYDVETCVVDACDKASVEAFAAARVTVLYRMAGSPAVSGEDSFTDTASGTWYSDAVLWASQNKVVNGVGGGRYGTDSATTQEQLVTMLWRNAGEYVVDNTEETGASSWAVNAVRWAKAEGLINEKGPAFEPTKAASRAQVADIVYRYLLLKEKYADVDAVSGATKKADEQAEPQEGTAGGKTLIAYFSRTGENYNVGTITEGNTAKLAKEIAAQTGGTLFEIEPVTAYPTAYSEMLTVATNERQSNARPEIKNKVEIFEQYDTIFIGYPIWWGDLPMILHSFMESYDFTGKKVIPFNTHEGSGQAGTQSTITSKLTGATVLRGLAMQGSSAQKLSGDGSNASVKSWLEGLGFFK